MRGIVGWDIGAVNVKAALLSPEQAEQIQVASQPLEIWRDKNQLPKILQSVYSALCPAAPPQAMAVTMTAELSDAFATKREGVLFVLDCLKTCLPDPPSYCLSHSGEFIPLNEALDRPLEFAAANWLASALWIAQQLPNCLLLDVGSTTTDIIPILDGNVHVSERTDLARLSSGELVYTGVLRTNLAAIVPSVPVAGQFCRTASEYFAISGDVHLILGNLKPQDYACPTPDGQPPSVDSARRRLARLVCADEEMLTPTEIDELARHIYIRQIQQIREGIDQVISRLPKLRTQPVVVLGTGAFLGKAAAAGMGLEVRNLAGEWKNRVLAVAPCLAAAHLLAEHLRKSNRQSSIPMSLDAVLKIGGSIGRGPALSDLCREVSRLGKRHSLLIVPGGGKFADQVREAYRQYKLNETSAHCMALLAMDQYGYILNELIENSCLTPDLTAAREVTKSGRTAILLPSTIVIRSDPLPHSWQVTSDTIAAWVAQLACCPRLVLLKNVDGLITAGKELIAEISAEKLAENQGGVDEYLSHFLSSVSLETWIINGASPGRLSELLETGRTVGTKIK